MKTLSMLIAAFSIAASPGAFAHQDNGQVQKAGPARKEQKEWGIAGDPRTAKRTIAIRMTDAMRFTPDRIEVRQGETVKLVVKNAGKMLHEFVIGTRKDLEEHAALMAKFPNMEHDEPYMAHVASGKSGQLIWHFNRAGEFDFGCLIPGHYPAGMVGKIKVLANP